MTIINNRFEGLTGGTNEDRALHIDTSEGGTDLITYSNTFTGSYATRGFTSTKGTQINYLELQETQLKLNSNSNTACLVLDTAGDTVYLDKNCDGTQDSGENDINGAGGWRRQC